MSEFLPASVRAELQAAHLQNRRRRKHRLSVHIGDESFPILRMLPSGFEVDREGTPHLRGLVDIFDGPRHLTQALIIASSEADGTMHYEFKRNTPASERPPVDFVRSNDLIQGLLPRD